MRKSKFCFGLKFHHFLNLKRVSELGISKANRVPVALIGAIFPNFVGGGGEPTSA